MATLTNLFKALSLAQIKDINIDSLKDNQILQYDELSKKWKNVTNSSISPPTYEFESGTTNGTFKVNTTIGKTTETTAVSIYGLGTGAYADAFTLDDKTVPVLSTAVNASGDIGKYVQYTASGWTLSNVSTTGGGTPYTLLAATDKALGGIKVGYSPPTDTANRNYPVKLDNDAAYVTVPWTDTNTTYIVGTGGGLSLDTTTNAFSIKLDATMVATTGTAPAIPATSGLSTTNGLRVDNTRVPVLNTAVATTATGYVHWTGSAWDLSTPASGGTSASYTAGSGISIDSTSNKISVDTAVIPKRYSLTVNPINKPTQTISSNGVNFTLLYAADTSILTLQCDSIIQSPSSITIINILSKKTSSKIFTITTDTKLSIDIPSMDMLTYPSGIIINMVI